ncbi:hypothetical protein TNCT_693051 [Trichonephila clavata]|uniref:Uncharacterized protein n=1 Tax=Trichonephila clavata TaxID=2740835 RepID=A0A8X6H181_TRICU|nr:hypothetical protein TNCT_693051 [Trichonephila clavata]
MKKKCVDARRVSVYKVTRILERQHGSDHASGNERSANPPLRLDGRTLGGTSRLLHDARSVGRERSTEYFHGSATAVCRRNERSANPPLRLDGRTFGEPSRLLHDARSVGRERSTESFHDTATAVCLRNERFANPPLRLDGRTLGGPSRLLHDARSVGRDCSTEYFHGSVTTVCRRNERSANPPLRLDEGPWVHLPACFTTQGRWVESALPNPSTARQRPCVFGTTGPPSHRLDLTGGLMGDRPACFTTQGRWVDSALRNTSTARQWPVCRRNERSANPPLRLDGRTLGGPSRLLHDARSVGRDCSTEFLARHDNGLYR